MAHPKSRYRTPVVEPLEGRRLMSLTLAAAGAGPAAVTTVGQTLTPNGAATATPADDATTGTVTGTATLNTAGTLAPRAGATLYLDANGNGVFDAGEVTATAAADGTFAFADLTPGTYDVRQLLPLGDVSTAPTGGVDTELVTAGSTTTGADFTAGALPASPLTAAVLSKVPARVVAGVTRTAVQVRVANGGTTAYDGPITAAVYASATGTVTTQDEAAAAVTRTVRLAAGRSAVVAVPVTVPAATTAGSYQLVAAVTGPTADAPALAAATGPVAVAAATVDLAPTLLAAKTGVAVKPGFPSTVTVRVTNNGTVTAVGPVTVTVFSTFSGAVDVNAAPLGVKVYKQLRIAAGRSATVRVVITGSLVAQPGTYQLVAMVTDVTTPLDLATSPTSAAVATRVKKIVA